MFNEHPFFFGGYRYTLIRNSVNPPDLRLGAVLSRDEAESVLRRAMRDSTHSSDLRRLYRELAFATSITQITDDAVLEWLIRQLDGGRGRTLVLVRRRDLVSRERPSAVDSDDAREARRVDGLIESLGPGDLLHCGCSYRVLRAQTNENLRGRHRYEAISDADARTALLGMAGEAHRPPRHKTVLEELAELFGPARPKKNSPEMLMLRLLRMQVVLADQGPPLTPSQVRRAREEHWIEVELVDDAKKPVEGVQLVLVDALGGETPLSSDGEGRVRLAPIAPGDVTIRLPKLDGDMWQPVGGAAARESTKGRGYITHVVRRGENLSRIARHYGLASWKKLWDDPKNETLRKKRQNPNILRPGDQVMVPGKTVREIVRAADATHRIRVDPPELSTFKVVLQDHNQVPFAEEDYELHADIEANVDPRRGTTDGSGMVTEQMPPTARKVRVSLPKRRLSWSFVLNELIPVPSADEQEEAGKPSVEAVKATQNRLNALGFPCGAVDGKLGRRTLDALAVFRRDEQEPSQSPEQESPVQVAQLELGELANLFTV